MCAIKQKILIVDDNPMNLAMLEEALEGNNYELYLAKNGNEALAIVDSVVPDLALLDIMMPIMNGFELLEKLRCIKMLDKMPVMFLTALDDGESKIRAFEAGAVDYIAKPFNSKEVVARVKAHLGIAKFTSSRDFLLRMAAHEYGVPLAVIGTSIQMQKMEYGDTEYLRAISSASSTLQSVYKDMSYFLTSESKSFEPVFINLGEFVASRVGYLKTLAMAYDNSFLIEDTDEEGLIYMNEYELERVIDNILSNAVKHSVKDGVIKVRIKASGEDRLVLEVENESRQIQDMKKLFEAFYRGDTRTNGLGLGLYLALRICEQNNADLTASSEDKKVFFNVAFKRIES